MPVAVTEVTELLPLFVTQISPRPSIATAVGALRPVIEVAVPAPAGVNTDSFELVLSTIHALPLASIATPEGPLRPPPL